MTLTPLFVADRPASLRILSALNKEKFGILSHPYTTERFKSDFRNFNCKIKIGDSGIYQGDSLTYEELFEEYVKMGVDYGIIKDYYRDRIKTKKSAVAAKKTYEARKNIYKFELIGVAQGRSVAEYLESYREQREELGFPIVAIGGLLDKTSGNMCTVRVTNSTMLKNVLTAIRHKFPKDKLFPLGIYNSRRLDFLNEMNAWASDYKGWIFRYDIDRSHYNGDRYQQITDYIENEVFKRLEKYTADAISRPQDLKRKKKRLLILSCGKKKSKNPGRAIDVYLGPNFQTVREYLKSNNGVDIKILSAKYGLIDYRERIIPYEQKMDKQSAAVYRELNREFETELLDLYSDVFIVGGKEYQSVFPQIKDEQRARGTYVAQRTQLKNWLYQNKESIHPGHSNK